jgi:transcriptional regulator with XRE-family HTH domain
MQNKVTLCDKIKSLRVGLNMSQERFGKKIGITGKTISAYETGRCAPPLKILEKISSAYDATFLTLDMNKKLDLASKIQTVKNVILDLEKRLLE